MKIKVIVKANAKKNKVKKVDEHMYKIAVIKPATDGKANSELKKLLKKHFRANIKICKGHSSRYKIIEIIQSPSTKKL